MADAIDKYCMVRTWLRVCAAGVITLAAVSISSPAYLHGQCQPQSFYWDDVDGGGHYTESCTVPGTPSYGWFMYATGVVGGGEITECYDYRAPYCEYADAPVPPPDTCGDERDTLIAEYQSEGVGFRPFCSSFTQSVPTQSQYSFGSPRQSNTWSAGDEFHWAILKDTVTGNLYCVLNDYGSTPTMVSGYRNPKHNTAIGGANNSRHVYGDAADIDTPAAPDDDAYNALRAIAKGGSCSIACVEPRDISQSHFHVDYRGACPSRY